MFIAIGESIIARVAALGGYISFSLTGRPKTPYEQVHIYILAVSLVGLAAIASGLCWLTEPASTCGRRERGAR